MRVEFGKKSKVNGLIVWLDCDCDDVDMNTGNGKRTLHSGETRISTTAPYHCSEKEKVLLGT